MSRYDSKSHDEVASKKSDEAQRRTRPANVGPPSPAQLAKLYAKGKESPDISAKDQTAIQHDDGHGPKYRNDTSGWVRSKGENSMANRPGGFDRGPVHGKPTSNKSERCEADGHDLHKSPFSAASRDRKEENDWSNSYSPTKWKGSK
jgi:hypothetical protein